MAKRSNKEQSLQDVLQDLYKKNHLEDGLLKVRVRELWFSELGSGVGSRTEIVDFRRDTLYVTLTSSVLREELLLGKQKILTMLNEKIGYEVVKKLELR